MKQIIIIMVTVLLLLPATSSLLAGDEGGTEQMSLWLGGSYYKFEDDTYHKKVREFGEIDDKTCPEVGFDYLSVGEKSVFGFSGHFEDAQNIFGRMHTTVSDEFKASFQYRAFTRQGQQDLLENFETREAAGGKIITHELTDVGHDYHINRDEIVSKVELLLSREHNLRLLAAHRTILEQGTEQNISSTHCYSCHATSRVAKVDRITNELEAALETNAGTFDIGYQFGYRNSQSNTPEQEAYYDAARHPVNGGSEDEFSSRLVWSDSSVAVSVQPEIEKMAHKFRLKGNLGQGRFASSLSFSRTINKDADLAADAWSGAFNYTVPLNNRTRLIAKLSGTKITSDDVYIDLPTFRDGRAGTTQSFDYWRYSSLDRTEGRLSAEVIKRMGVRTVLSLLGEFKRVDRTNYPELDDGLASSQFAGQAKLRYYRGLTFSASAKYRFEKTSDPFANLEGIFESRGNGTLGLLPPDGDAFIFYYQREELRYQTVTTVPTDEHTFDVQFSYRPEIEYSVNFGVKGSYEKNGDLDSLDVSSFTMRPNVSLNVNPNPKVSLTAGFTYDYRASKGPIAIALFDG